MKTKAEMMVEKCKTVDDALFRINFAIDQLSEFLLAYPDDERLEKNCSELILIRKDLIDMKKSDC